ncbi:unnamed protein product, partial [Symbiodinium microadriaticum]
MVRLWAIAVISSLPDDMQEKTQVVLGPLQTLRAALIVLYRVAPGYARPVQVACEGFAQVIATVQEHVQQGCPPLLRVSDAGLPNVPRHLFPDYSEQSLRHLVMVAGPQATYRAVKCGLAIMNSHESLLFQREIDGVCQDVMQMLNFADDVLSMCKILDITVTSSESSIDTGRNKAEDDLDEGGPSKERLGRLTCMYFENESVRD